ncbi:hypothetical protein LCGC14_1531370 [marine sediment metagenome]|uniref:Teneurin-like YD-shell domain-containing protein n=1 Tax=marine sediment metagenome TaxID=412755 RepID=A0A0F9LBL2_9ZZZZ
MYDIGAADFDEDGHLDEVVYSSTLSDVWSQYVSGLPRTYRNRALERVTYSYDGLAMPFDFDGGYLTSKDLPGDDNDASYTYDDHGNLITATNGLGTVVLDYDDNDRLGRVTYPDGLWVGYGYDAAGRRSSVTDHTGHSVTYLYDTVGRLWRVVDDGGADIARYTYDVENRLVFADDGSHTWTYTYDALGNRSAVTDETGYTLYYLTDPVGMGSLMGLYDDSGLVAQLDHGFGPVAYDTAGQLGYWGQIPQ